MNLAQAYFAAHEPQRKTVLGVPLQILCLGHRILLHAHGCRFLTGEPPTLDDLLLAVWVCAQSYRDAADALHTGKVALTVSAGWWLWKRDRVLSVPVQFDVMLWRQALGEVDLVKEANEFRAYLADGCAHPSFHCRFEQSEPIAQLPIEQTVKVALMEAFHIDEAAILARSWALCLWDYLTLQQQADRIALVEDEGIDLANNEANYLQHRLNAGLLKL